MRRTFIQFSVIVVCLVLSGQSAFGRSASGPSFERGKEQPLTAAAVPAYCLAEHNVGKLVLGVSNYGIFGAGDGFIQGSAVDCFTGERVFSCEYPKGSRTRYLYAAAFWIGAVVGRDTLVSVGADGWTQSQEFYPDEAPFGNMIYRSITDPSRPEFENAISEQDYIAVYTDTFTSGVAGLTNDEVDNTPHQPLHVEVTQRSFAWSYPYAEDFVLFDYSMRNIGRERLRQVYMGIYVDADVYQEGLQGASATGFQDDICGFIQAMPTNYGGCDWLDTVNIAWIADNDGDLDNRDGVPVPNVTGTRIVRTPSDSLEVSFNWWVSNMDPTLDFGPQRKGKVRNLSTGGMGTPAGDRNKYYFMRNKEFDYDQVFTAQISPTDPDWEYPNQRIAKDISNGYDTRYLLSFGPFNVDPGQTLPLSFAYVGGMDLHYKADNGNDNLVNNYDPQTFYENLSFSDLGLNSVWASWVYDNPGVDSDSDGYAGEFRECIDGDIVDTVWYKGDGVPDFRGASPPPAPTVWVYPQVGSIRVRWNGLRSETTRDVFSREYDFEGYRVYMGRDARDASYSVVSSYDIEDYNKWVWSSRKREWQLKDIPFTLEELRCLYADSCKDPYFDPLIYGRGNPYRLVVPGGEDSAFYFEPQDFNRSELGVTTGIQKVYPEQPYPSNLNPDSARADELTDDGYLKYFEYEYTIDGLLPTVSYYVNVTAFDYGSPQSDLASLETSKTLNPKQTYPMPTSRDVAARDLQVYTYPNPYKGDGSYLEKGFEGRDADYLIPDRLRRIHFANLPARCTIRIYTLDGDLVREIVHDMDPADPLASHDEWDLITRNTQMVVSGIYYWTVEDENGNTQIGKQVIIM